MQLSSIFARIETGRPLYGRSYFIPCPEELIRELFMFLAALVLLSLLVLLFIRHLGSLVHLWDSSNSFIIWIAHYWRERWNHILPALISFSIFQIMILALSLHMASYWSCRSMSMLQIHTSNWKLLLKLSVLALAVRSDTHTGSSYQHVLTRLSALVLHVEHLLVVRLVYCLTLW